MEIIKRNGKRQEFDISKVSNAVEKAMLETQEINEQEVYKVTELVNKKLKGKEEVTVEGVQDIVEESLMGANPTVAKNYILYRKQRDEARNTPWNMTELQKSIWENKYKYEDETFDGWLDRVSDGNDTIRKRIKDRQFLFGGRILANRGLEKEGRKVTYSNCYVLTPPEDNLEGIFGTASDMARTYSYGGGVGISLRNLRPRDSKVYNNARTTSGAVSFMPIYSLTTETIGQNGRRGALMLSIPSSHPDLEEFVDVKTEQDAVTGANVSVEIDNEFMEAVRDNKQYKLHFEVEDTGEEIEKYVDANKLYEKLVKNNWDWAEPGMLFWDRMKEWHFMSADPNFEYAGTNPCAEEPLPAGGSCLLGSLNLSEFVVAPFTERAEVDYRDFKQAVRDGVVALNEVVDDGLPLHPLQEQRETVKDLRQIGLGIMGLYDMLIKLGMTYGSKEALELSEELSSIMINEATQESARMAKEQGTFRQYDWDNLSNSEFFKNTLSDETKEIVKENGLRNSQILCIAPTGSISTMLGISGGIEPAFSLSYNRTTKSLHGEDKTYKVEEAIVNEWRESTGNMDGALPEMFVTAMTLDWTDRVNMQSAWQYNIDASISSTINLPKEITVDETMDLYMYAWEKGLKGATIFRDGCKRMGILTLGDDEEDGSGSIVSEEEEEEEEEVVKATGFFSTCAECGSTNTVFAEGCITCRDCGYSPC